VPTQRFRRRRARLVLPLALSKTAASGEPDLSCRRRCPRTARGSGRVVRTHGTCWMRPGRRSCSEVVGGDASVSDSMVNARELGCSR
jgi:hypothetical protein